MAAPTQILVSGNQCVAVPGVSCRAFVLNATQPLPATVKVYGNDFPTSGYFAGPDYATGIAICSVDGRIQWSTTWMPISVEAHESITATYIVPGADESDVVVCNHTSASGGVILSGAILSRNSVIITLANVSDRALHLSAGRLLLDIWKR